MSASNEESLNLIYRLSQKLSVELDYHYEDDQLSQNSEEIALIGEAKQHLESRGIDISEATEHILDRFELCNDKTQAN